MSVCRPMSDAESVRGGHHGQLRVPDSRRQHPRSAPARRVHPRLGRLRPGRLVRQCLFQASLFFWGGGAPCGLGGVVVLAHLVSWPSVVRGNWTRVVLFCCILACLLFLICIEFVYLYFPIHFVCQYQSSDCLWRVDRLRNDLYCVEWGVKLCSILGVVFPPPPKLAIPLPAKRLSDFVL